MKWDEFKSLGEEFSGLGENRGNDQQEEFAKVANEERICQEAAYTAQKGFVGIVDPNQNHLQAHTRPPVFTSPPTRLRDISDKNHTNEQVVGLEGSS